MNLGKLVYFDRYRGGKNRVGSWTTIIRSPNRIVHEPYETEAQARAAIGLEGGSTDPRYVPEGTGCEEAS